MSESPSKSWDWTKNVDDYWLEPCIESAYLAERWLSKGFTKVLDLGCGLGRHSIYMAEHGFNVTAADLSDFAVQSVKERSLKKNLTIETRLCNMLSLPFENDSFDCIMAYNVIYHTDSRGLVISLDAIKRVLRPGGELFLTLISKNTFSYQNIEKYKRVDENTILRDEHETEKDVPHFYVDLDGINKYFQNGFS